MRQTLSDDERAVLMIAGGGLSMIPIGRWEVAVKALASRGLLEMLDSVNYVITDEGRAALKAADEEENQAFREIAAMVAHGG